MRLFKSFELNRLLKTIASEFPAFQEARDFHVPEHSIQAVFENAPKGIFESGWRL